MENKNKGRILNALSIPASDSNNPSIISYANSPITGVLGSMDSRTISIGNDALHKALNQHETVPNLTYLNIISTEEMVCRDGERHQVVAPCSHSHHWDDTPI
jgi:hypothetical protein